MLVFVSLVNGDIVVTACHGLGIASLGLSAPPITARWYLNQGEWKNRESEWLVLCMFDCMHSACSWWNVDLGVVSDVERHLSPSEDDHQNNSDNFSETQPILMLTGPQAGFQQQQQPPAPGQGDQSLVFLPACLPSIFQAIRFQGKCPPTRVTVCSWASD